MLSSVPRVAAAAVVLRSTSRAMSSSAAAAHYRRRSVMFCPATNTKAMAKLPTLSNLDAVIIDLEDAVSVSRKDEVRAHAWAGGGT